MGIAVYGQSRISLRSADKAECVKSDMTSLKASFSFSTLEAQDMPTQRGLFSRIDLPHTVMGGNEGDPQIPVINELIAVPFGATPRIEITSYTTTDYRLDDYGIHTLVPRQPSLRKDKRPDEVPFVMNEAAYQSTRGFRSEPKAIVSVEGTMRGVQLGKMTIEPVSYDPVNNTLRVFNDIEVEVHFDGTDRQATEDMLVKTYSPYFDIVYKQLFNNGMIREAYEGYPDLYTTPVKMLVITTSKYSNSEPFQNWLTWKKQKGIDVDLQIVTSTTSGTSIRSLIQNRYNANHPTFLVIVGDENDVICYETYNVPDNFFNPYVSDNGYASVDNDIYHDLYLSRMPVSTVTELGNLVDKILTYEKYTMSDPSYLDNALLIAGSDANGWDDAVGRPTMQYAMHNYFNTEHGFSNVYGYITDDYDGCYDHLSTGVGFANYTAHGDIQKWSTPEFTNTDANALTNTDKYFLAVGNCCLSANWGNNTYTPCLGETLIRAAEKGAFGYIGSVVETYWFEDYYFAVGAHDPYPATEPDIDDTGMGMYDALFDDTEFNAMGSIPYIGNVATTCAHAAGYEFLTTDEYCWRAYQCFGDGSVMPYMTQPDANQVSHASTLGIGINYFTVDADPGSYVALSRDGELLGVAEVDETGSVNVPITPVNTAGDVLVVVTRNQRQPYIQTIQAVTIEEAYIIADSYTPTIAQIGDDIDLSIVFKNVGNNTCTGTTNISLTTEDPNVTIISGTGSFGTLASNATATLSNFQFRTNSGMDDDTAITLHYSADNGSNTWEGDITINAVKPVLTYEKMSWEGGFVPGETLTVTARFVNNGHYQATNAIATMSTTSDYVLISNPSITVGTIEAEEEVVCTYTVTFTANCPEDEEIPVTFTLTADGGFSAQGSETLKNTCSVIFNLNDSYGDGWNSAKLTVSFDDGSASQDLTIASGNSSATYTLEINHGTHVTLTWTSGYGDDECSFTVSYEGNALIFMQGASPTAGVLYEFDCNCGASTNVFSVTATSSDPSLCSVSGGGEFNYGDLCTLTATLANGCSLTGWMENGEVVSTANPYTFTVTDDHQFTAAFGQAIDLGQDDSNNDYLPSYSFYEYALSQQIYTADEIGMTCTVNSIAFFNKGSEDRTRSYDIYLKHTDKSAFSSKNDWVTVSASDKVYSGTVVMATSCWTIINFDTPFEYDGTSNLVVVMDDNTNGYAHAPYMSCSVYNTDASQAIIAYSAGNNYDPSNPPPTSEYHNEIYSVKNHIILGIEADMTQTEQNVDLANGWTWWSPTINSETLLNQIETQLGSNGIRINSESSGSAIHNEGLWSGDLQSLISGQMYKIQTNASCTLSVTGAPITTAIITINQGENWFGYIGSEKTIAEAFAAFTPADGDKIISQDDGFAVFNGSTWKGTLTTLLPGHGYVYYSTATGTKTIVFE